MMDLHEELGDGVGRWLYVDTGHRNKLIYRNLKLMKEAREIIYKLH
jgi:hypothetical protein